MKGPSVDVLMDQAAELLRATAPAQALAPLLEAWRVTRSTGLAAMIWLVSESATAGRVEVPGHTSAQRLTAALNLVRERNAADLPRLIRCFFHLTIKDARTLVGELSAWPADPRVLDLALEIYTAPPWITEDTTRPFFNAMASFVAAQGDPRTHGRIEAWRAEAARHRHISKSLDVALAGPTTAEQPLGAELLQTVQRALARLQETSATALLEADPTGDETCAVYADMLSDAGDPQGEFIALELAALEKPLDRPQELRRRELEDKYRQRWCGRLWPFLLGEDTVRFARGFPAAVQLQGLRMLPAIARLAEASTLLEIWGIMGVRIGAQQLVEVLKAPNLSALRCLDLKECVGRFAGDTRQERFAYLRAFLAVGPLPLQSIAIQGEIPQLFGVRDALETTVLLNEAFPSLRQLVLRTDDLPAQGWIYKTALGKRVRSVRGSPSGHVHRALFGLLARRTAIPDHIADVTVSSDLGMFRGWSHRLDRDSAGELGRLSSRMLRHPHLRRPEEKLEGFVQLLESLPEHALTSIELDSYKGTVAKPVKTRLEQAARRQKRLASLELFGTKLV